MIDPKIVERLKASERSIQALLDQPTQRPGRRFPAYAADAIAEYSKLVGEITWASNRLHASMAWIFVQLVQPQSFTVGLEIWNSVKTDSAQRDMLKGATIGSMKLGRLSFGPKIIWLCDAVGRVAAYRNDAVHTPMITKIDERGKWRPVPDAIAPVSRAQRLEDKRFWRLFKLLRGDLIELNHYASGLSANVSAEHLGRKLEPLPKRPLLRSHAFLPRSQAPKPPPTGRRRGRKYRRQASHVKPLAT
jgi:hypothetical protein